MKNSLLPTTKDEMAVLGWSQPDVVLITGDAYVDHPSFGAALIGRWLTHHSFKVAILAQPDWHSVDDFRQFGPPRLFWAITSGCIDSKLNTYASMGNKRREDVYSPGGKLGMRPDRPLVVYSERARQAYKGVPIILGGLEASLRRLVHYDYIADKLQRSVLADAKADLLVHGMGELAILEIAKRLDSDSELNNLHDIPGTAYRVIKGAAIPDNAVELLSREMLEADNVKFMDFQIAYQNEATPTGRAVVQDQGPGQVVVHPPAVPLTEKQLDILYSLPFTRTWHPKYDKAGGVPALKPVQFSITTHRGCFGGCSFCAIYFHQGKQIASRSTSSIINELDCIAKHPKFRGTVEDIGGPTANMYGMKCSSAATCKRMSCLFPSPCSKLPNHDAVIKMLNRVLQWRNAQMKKPNVFIASGIRHDLTLQSPDYIRLLAKHFVGGHLKVAPEHICSHVLDMMQKPHNDAFEEFEREFDEASKKAGKKQYLVPYFISGHPGSSPAEAEKLTEYLVKRRWRPRQVQDFVPAPLALATAMYVSGRSPKKKPIHIPRGRKEKRLQLALLQYYNKRNFKTISQYLSPRGKHKLLAKINNLQLD